MPRVYPDSIKPPNGRRPSHWAPSKAVYLICLCLSSVCLPSNTFCCSQILQSPSVSLLFLYTHPPSVITQTTVQPAPKPAEFQTGPF